MTRLPDLEDLALLVLVARTGSIGRAAAQLGISQPSASRRLAHLERRHKTPRLLNRTRQGSTLTPTGVVVVDWASTLLAAADQFTRSVEALRQQGSVTVRAGVSMTIAEQHAPSWVATLQHRAPELVVSLVVDNSTNVADLVESGGVDVGFVESPTVRRTLRRRRVGWDEVVVAAPPGHAWATRRGPISVGELASTPLLVREPGSGTRETVQRALRAADLDLRPGVVMNSNFALKAAALAGVGPVVLSELTLAAEIAAGELVKVPVEGLDLHRPLNAVWRRDEPLSPGVTALIETAGQVVA